MGAADILVTGGAGFIGSHLVERLLAEGKRVVCLDNFNGFYDPALKRANVAGLRDDPRFVLVEGDIRDERLVDEVFGRYRFEAVVHLAAMAGVRPSIEQPHLYNEVNVVGTTRLLEACRRHGVEQFVFGSSSSVYGVNAKVPFSEEDRVEQTISPYAATKVAGEALCHVYHHLYGLRVAALRFFTVYGPRGRPEMAIATFIRKVLAGEDVPIFGDGTVRRDYTFVDDIVDGIVAALRLDPDFEIINLGDARTVTLNEVVRLVEASTRRKAKVTYLAAQPGDVPITYADVSKARRLLGYEPKVALEQGIAATVRWQATSAGEVRR